MLSKPERRRYARQLLLPEIGPEGQQQLLSAKVFPLHSADSRVAEVAGDYLRRAGVQWSTAPTAEALERDSAPETADKRTDESTGDGPGNNKPSPAQSELGTSATVGCLALPASAQVAQLAGHGTLAEAAAALLGAYAAVEEIKRLVGAGQPGTIPDDWNLAQVVSYEEGNR